MDKLNAELLSERARHEKHTQELRVSHSDELTLIRQRHEGDISRVQSEVERLQEREVKVQYMYAHVYKYSVLCEVQFLLDDVTSASGMVHGDSYIL